MCKRLVPLAFLFIAAISAGADKQGNWLQVTSPHFVVVSNGSEKQARHVADQFEHMRAVFQKLFPKLEIDPGAPIIVLAINGDKGFRALEPETYLAKGQLKLGGLFQRGQDKNYVLMRLDAEGPHPYSVIYHEYTHLLLSKAEWMPLWLNEGLAEFYQNTDIHEKEVDFGEPSPENVALLRQSSLLPLPTLFRVDTNSPYYHEETKGSIFYAESWSLIFYLMNKQFHDKSELIPEYGRLLAQGGDTVTAAERSFGDLKQLLSSLQGFVGRGNFSYFKMPGATEVEDSTMQVRPLSLSDADAVRADFLAYNGRLTDAQVLLNDILQQDKNNVSAHETMGFLQFRQGHIAEARKWYGEAVKLDSQSYLANYYYAAMSMNGISVSEDQSQIVTSFRACIKLKPSFTPCYDGLASSLAAFHGDLDEARTNELQAISLDPTNLRFRMNMANILLQMQRSGDAVRVLQAAQHLAKSPEETAMFQNFLLHVQEFADMQENGQKYSSQLRADHASLTTSQTDAADTAPAPTLRRETPPTGPHHFLLGILKNVRCNNPAIDLDLASGSKTLSMHNASYFKIQYTALNFKPAADLNPCHDLEGRSAKVEYISPQGGNNTSAYVVGIELQK